MNGFKKPIYRCTKQANINKFTSTKTKENLYHIYFNNKMMNAKLLYEWILINTYTININFILIRINISMQCAMQLKFIEMVYTNFVYTR